MKRRYVVIALAAIAAIAIASPGLGVSLRKLVRKEVARQISKATGPAGATGSAGATGQQGPAGPTFGVTGVPGLAPTDPPASPDETEASADGAGRHFAFSLPTAGKAYIRAVTPLMGRDCTAGTARAGLYLDGAPLAATSQAIAPSGAPRDQEFLTVAQAGAGGHNAYLRQDCPTGNLAGATGNAQVPWTVLLLGG